MLARKAEAFQQDAAAKLAPIQQRKRQADDTFRAAFDTCERACRQERDLLRQLEDLTASERTMYELDHAGEGLLIPEVFLSFSTRSEHAQHFTCQMHKHLILHGGMRCL